MDLKILFQSRSDPNAVEELLPLLLLRAECQSSEG
jgi:hypothetical protein